MHPYRQGAGNIGGSIVDEQRFLRNSAQGTQDRLIGVGIWLECADLVRKHLCLKEAFLAPARSRYIHRAIARGRVGQQSYRDALTAQTADEALLCADRPCPRQKSAG